ncbi:MULTISPECIES: hypothetical protein [Legionella]|uniref:Uncharacterized protein n=1 Tax=Legionella donaldsonii TaxID=45060 RepID=A0A378J9C4_9GAMM|nr:MULTISPECIES: hypothetical protein [Legionella]MCC5013669.1 hypothetical protein [Legionella sp. 31fI33]STX41170.1 Uncharacterised protein [Legionella donaldsonii]
MKTTTILLLAVTNATHTVRFSLISIILLTIPQLIYQVIRLFCWPAKK